MEKLQECVNKIQSNLDEMKKLLEPQKKEGDLDIIKSVKELILDENYYFIPEYQRGYKWDENNINALLNDIAEFLEDKNNDKKFYCMQPIIVLEDGDKWRVLDGQQRLTTFYILCKYLKLDIKSSIEYKTREKSKNFLEEIEEEAQSNDEKCIDFYFMKNAYNVIKEWFKKRIDAKEKIKKLLQANKQDEKYMGCIWYKIENESSTEEDVFSRVNSGKIPLTNAELIKARILNIKNFENGSKATQAEIANEWDNIEYSLQNEEFFGFLVQNGKKYTNKIELLFEIYYEISNDDKSKKIKADIQKGEHTIFEFINKKLDENENIDFWKEIKSIYLTLKSWFNEPELYNLIGFILNVGIEEISKIYEKSKCENTTKTEFKAFCKERIKEKILNLEDNKKDVEKIIDELNYENKKLETQNILLLFNIIAYKDAKQKFSFVRYKNEKWSLEHIHSQHDNPAETIKDEKQRQQFVEDAKKSLGDKANDIEDYKAEDKNDEKFNEIVKKISEISSDNEVALHGIGNLALLSCGDNASLSNNIFSVKRKRIKELDEKGHFIPMCTKNTFMKYYSGDIKDTIRWTSEDSQDYKNRIIESIKEFFDGEEK